MTDKQLVSPIYRYITLFVLLPALLVLIYLSLTDKTGNMGDTNSLIMFIVIVGIPISVVLLPKQTQAVIKAFTPFGKTIDKYSNKVEVWLDGLFVGMGKTIWFIVRYIIYPIVCIWLTLKFLGLIVRFLIHF